jgi:5-methylcytosine-specific restriction endonuclease McrA
VLIFWRGLTFERPNLKLWFRDWRTIDGLAGSQRRTRLQKPMQELRQKRPRLKLGPEEYNSLRNRVLERDGWRCQSCGSSKNLQVHHLSKRSELGDDALDNLITLCAACHLRQHRMPAIAEKISR